MFSMPDALIVSYKDDATAFNGQKKGTIVGKGAYALCSGIRAIINSYFARALKLATPDEIEEEKE